MFSTMKRIYKKTGNKDLVRKAYKKGWITEEQMIAIIGKDEDKEETAATEA